MSLATSIRRMLRVIRESLPGVSTPASRMYGRARSQRPWTHVPPHQQAQTFVQHQQVLRTLQLKHAAAKVAPIIIDWLYGVVTSPRFWKFVFDIAFIAFLAASCERHT